MRLPLVALLACSSLLLADDHGQGHGKHGKHGKGGKHEEHGRGDRDDQGRGGAFVPPGLAKKGGLPPGLAKKYGRRMPERPYIAVDPRYPDRAYFLIDGRWQLQKGLSVSVQAELRDVLRMPLAPPPVPLPKVGVDLHVVLFN